MNTETFLKAYNAIRNGTDLFHFNPLYRTFHYSDGVKECAEAGCYWLLDILGTELPQVFQKHPDDFLLEVKVLVTDKQSVIISGSFDDDAPDAYTKTIKWSDLPQGTWQFLVSGEGNGPYHCILISEY